ncbi:glutathione S-transferase family protein [Anianabacter salinae]|uniref:glutathione S-transferase family protein n=1 Tax=Anianabacter salinae TaxID=2851023 RepID=UPI00225DE834|nr:glutathione S-transferase family protein [Anianabacter salinae]MBV0913622.1 glutathione S-transferase family protein [Anianabacter salinae]
MLTLHDNPASPYCRKVRVLLHESGQTDDVEIAYAVGHPLAPEQMPTSQNPLGKIPTLERGEGPAIYDSRVICRYLDARAKAGLYPETRLWEVLTLEATADGIMDAAILMVYESRSRPEDKRFDGWVEAQWVKVDRSLHAIEAKWMVNLAGPLDMGQVAVGCALGYLDFRHAARDWRKDHPALADWFAGFAERPSMQATAPSA